MFNDAEAIALTLGLIAIREYRFPLDVAAVEGALAKTERVMPEALLNQARGLQEAITFNVSLPPVQPQISHVSALSSAVRQKQQVRLRYQSFQGDESERAFDPYGIVFNEGWWYTSGYCHLRRDLRTFRLDRIVALEPTNDSFERPADFDVLAHVLNSLITMPGTEQIEVLLETSLEQARDLIPAYLGTLEASDKGVIFRRPASQLEWVAHVLLNLDVPVHIVQNDALREIIRQIGERARQMVAE
jgi:predicted DNA-binding transcriptional regulator YafY